MVRPKRIDRKAQSVATYTEIRLSEEKRKHFLGCAKIDLKHLNFSQSSARELDDENIQRLLSAFKLRGCLRLDIQYHVPATINAHFLGQVVRNSGASMTDVRSHEAACWPTLRLPEGSEIECLHGQHRLAAARRYLLPRDQWWIVDLYSTGTTAFPFCDKANTVDRRH